MDLEVIKQKREQEAEDFKQISQTARIVSAINKQTATIKVQNKKLDKIIELLTPEAKEEPEAVRPKLVD